MGVSPPRNILIGEWEIGSPLAVDDFSFPIAVGDFVSHRRGSLLLPIAVGERLPSPIAVGDRSIVSHRRGKPTRYSHAVGASPPRDILFGEWEIGSPTAARDFLIPYRCGSMPTISHRRGRQARGFPSPWETTRYFHRGALP